MILVYNTLGQQFGNNHSVGRHNYCNLYKNMPHFKTKLKRNKLSEERGKKSLNKLRAV